MAPERPLIDREPDAGRLDARGFCGVVPWRLIAELADGDEITACYIVRDAPTVDTAGPHPLLRLSLTDRTGTIDGIVRDQIDRWRPFLVPRAIIGVKGRVGVEAGRRQLLIESVAALRTGPGDLEYLLPSSGRDHDLMERELEAQVASVRERPLRTLLRRCLGRDTQLGRTFREHQAATRNHHAYLYGLLEHTLSVTAVCDRLYEHYRNQGIQLDRDLLITGALLHDVGKVEELRPPPETEYTTPGRLIGHIILGIQIVGREAASVPGLSEERLLLLQHLIASHQGKPEWDSPRVPQLREAFVLHYADDLDSKMNQAQAALERVEPGGWSSYDRNLGTSLYQPRVSSGTGGRSAGDPSEAVIDLFRG
jgi:3'-5' exoribonuclease